MLPLYLEVPAELRKAETDYVERAGIQLGLARRVRMPATPRGLLFRLAIRLCPALALSSLLAIVLFRIETPAPAPEVAYYLLPGHTLPEAVSCDSGDPGFRYMSYCRAFQEGAGLVNFTYDTRTEVIRSASLAVDGVTIGDLILARGNPDSYRRESEIIQIYWGEKSALVSAPLNPASRVRVILYYLNASDEPKPRLEWRGFVTIANSAG